MTTSKDKIKQLQILIEDNFLVAKHCRNTMETISEISLRHYFQKLAAKRSQFAMELGQQMNNLGEKNPYIPSSTFENRWPEISDENKLKNIKKCLRLFKQSVQKYKNALSKINEGNCREVLIRHKVSFAFTLAELRTIKKMILKKIEKIGSGSNEKKERVS